ncbi:Ig-like domain (group 3) [Antarctobacter heliothermus]|uniref:Ig-like domain (Group 3) n=1 Tax=Antarctobacter heliothermus TaxID=74033 RepID=A0A239HEM4_9RHOB|nr:Ig-like domain (group 3) [Antarctobacter heliothermus]
MPAGYTVAFDQDPVNAANETAMSFTFAGAEVGTDYAYSIASDGGGAPVTGSGTIATITDVVSGLDLSGLGDGTLTLTVALTDAAGNTGVDATDTVAKDVVAPALSIDTPIAGDGLISTAEASAVILTGTATDLADGATVNVAVADGAAGSVTGTAAVSGGIWTTTLNLSTLADGALGLAADAVDAAGNPAPQATASATLDTAVPTGYTVAFDQDPVNLSNQTAIGVTVSGAEVGATVALRISSDGGASIVTPATVSAATATVNVTGLDLSSLADGTLTVTAILTDPAGNSGSAVTGTATKDTVAPSLAIDSPLAGDDVINAAEATAVTISGTATGLADGTLVTVNVTDTGAGLATGTASVAGGVWTLSLDVTGLADGALGLTADASDAGGNPAPQATATATKDADIPVVTIDGPIAGDDVINGAEAASFAVSGTATGVVDGTIVRLTLRDTSSTAVYYREATVSAGSWSLDFDIAALADGSYDLSADVTDLAGNPAVQATTSLTKDTTAPTIEILDPAAGANAFFANAVNAAEAATFAANGSALNAADATQVALTATSAGGGSVSTTTTVTFDRFDPGPSGPIPVHVWASALDLSTLGDGAVTLTAVITDAAGNNASTSTSFLKDTTAPAGYSATLDQDPVNIANQTAASFTFADAEVGPGAPGTEVTFAYSITSDGGGAPVTGTGTIATATDQVTGIDLSGLPDGTLTLSVALTDFKGNTGSDATDTTTKDATAPGLAFDAPLAGDDVVNGAEAASTVISGTSTDLLDGATVNVSVSDGAAGLATGVATVSGGVWSVTIDLTSLADGALGLTADASDAAGNPAPQATGTLSKDVVAPSGYSATLDQDPVNGGNQAAISFTFAGAEVGASFAYTITSDGGGTPVTGAGTIASATDQISGLDLTPLSDGTVTLTVALTDPAGNTGVDATDAALKDVAVPTATLLGPVAPQSDPFAVTLTFSEVVTGLDLTSVALVNGTASALTGSGANYSFTVTPDHDGTVEIALNAGAAADVVGNLSTAATAITVTADLTGTPNPTPLPDADGDFVPDILETGDRDGDGIPDDEDFDPQGYFYCEDDGRIIPGGGFTVSGPSGSNASLGTLNDINITRDGSTGEIQWFALRPGTYSMSLSYPTAVGIPSTARLSSGTLDLTTLLPANPAVIGSSEFGATGFLTDGSLGANPAFYTGFVIEAGDPFVLSNNIPMTQCAENLVTVTASTDGAEANGGAVTDASFTVTQGRVSTVDTVISYTVAGSATSGADFTALSGTVTIPAGATSATITVPVLEDGDIEGPETVEITLTGVTAGDLTTLLGTTVTRSATIADDDFADIAVVNVDLVTNEGGGDDATMTFALLGSPTSPVTLSFAGDNQCTVAPASITFTAADYTVPQALTIRAIDDDKVEGTHSCQPTVVVSSADTRYDGAPLALATVTVTDDLVDQIREPLTEILEDDLKETITTQTKAFSRMAKGALQRLQAGRDLPCGTIEGFDVDGSVQIQDATGAARGTFGRDAYNCVTDTREIIDGTFSLNKTEDTGMQALLQFAWQRERFVSDEALSGYFLGGYYSRTDVSGLGDGSIDGFGVNGGLYGARSFAQGLFLDYYVAGAAGRHKFDIDFDAAAAPINATGQYSYLAGFAGVGISGERAFDSFVMKPRVGLDLSYAKAGDADVTATQLGLSHDGVIDLDDFSGVRATAEIRFESLASPGGAEALAGMMRTAFTPRFVCELSSYDDDTNCGVGLAFAWERTDAASGLTWGLEVDVEQIDDNRRFTFNIKRERPIANGRGAIVTRLSMPEVETLQLEHGLKLDF